MSEAKEKKRNLSFFFFSDLVREMHPCAGSWDGVGVVFCSC